MIEIEKAKAYLKDAVKVAEKNNLEQEVFKETKNIINTAISALEKQVEKKIKRSCNKKVLGICPECGRVFWLYDFDEPDYCSVCGQKLDWSEVKSE